MADEEPRPAAGSEALRAEDAQPKLSAGFFQQLLKLPSCKISGVCDGCGRCEH